MKKIFLLPIFFLLTSIVVSAQVLPIKKGGQWGAINPKAEIIINPQYESISTFNEQGWAAFRKEGKAGVINQKGAVVVPAEYEQVKPISSQYIAVWQNGKCGVVNTQNEIVLKPAFDLVDTLSAGLFRVQIAGKYGISNIQGEAVLAASYDKMGRFEDGFPVAGIEKEGKKGILVLSPDELVVKVYEAIYEKVEFTDAQHIQLYQQKGITEIVLDETGVIASEQDYVNAVAYKLAKEKATRQEVMASGEDPRLPRWQKDRFHYILTDALGRNLLGALSFFQLNVDEEQGLAMGIYQTPEKALECYVIVPDKAQIALKVEAKDLIITDFQTSDFARITIDTLFDGLVNKQGDIISELGGMDITNIGNFEDGRAVVQCGKQFGFIDTKGQVAIPIIYEVASDFKNGYAIARQASKFGCIDASGKTVVPFEYDGIDVPSGGVLRVKKGRGSQGKWGLINMQNQVIAPFEYTIISEIKDKEAVVRQGKKQGVINTQGKVVVPVVIEADYLGPFNKGIAEIGMERMVENIAGRPEIRYQYKGYVNRDGAQVVAPKYEFIHHFDSIYQAGAGLSKVVLANKIGYINAKGQEVIAPIYSAIEGFEEVYMKGAGLAKIKQGDKFGYIDAKGNVVLEPAYSMVDGFDKALQDTTKLAQAGIDGKFGYINHQEKPIIPLVYDRISPIFGNTIIVQQDDKFGLIDTSNEAILPIEYDGIRFVEGAGNQLLAVYKGKAEELTFNGKGEVISHQPATKKIEPSIKGQAAGKYKYLTDFDSNGLAVVTDGAVKGLINRSGKMLTKLDYQEIGEFVEGMAYFQLDHKDRKKRLWGYMNTQGEQVIPATYNMAKNFGNGLAPVLVSGRWGYIDTQGKIAITAQYRQAEPFTGDYAWINETEVIDKKGKAMGKFVLDGKPVAGFSSGKSIAEVASGQLHLRSNAQPAYYATYDEVTPYIGDIAFVKKGEKWVLTREIRENFEGKVQGREVEVPFTKAGKRYYIETYGQRDKKTTKEGIDIKDKKWEKVYDGQWRMIDHQGYFVGETTYQKLVTDLANGTFTAEVSGLVGIVNLSGKFIAQPEQELVEAVSKDIVKVVSFGRIGYLKADGSWLWPLTK